MHGCMHVHVTHKGNSLRGINLYVRAGIIIYKNIVHCKLVCSGMFIESCSKIKMMIYVLTTPKVLNTLLVKYTYFYDDDE